MFITYLKERRSWILLFLLLQFLAVFIAYIDSAVSLTSILYYVFLSLIIFMIFLVMRYQKEMKFYQELEEAQDTMDFSHREFLSPFERMAAESITRHFEGLRNKVSENERMLDEEKDELLSWIHEVKTPLTALSLMIDRLEDQRLKKEMTYEWLRIHLLLDQQLHQRRIPFMENDLYIERTDLESVIFGEVKTLQSWCIQKGIGFDFDLESKEVMTDAKWLAFIIRQLLTNAVKYSERSDILITSDQRNGQTILEVADTGRGIDSRDLPRIFEKGFTSTAHHQDNAATGMGLYLARKAADSLKIKIDVESAPGKGSTFKLTFPKSNDFVRITGM
ncbi:MULTISPECIES: sensor histidine kinase [unclassified Mesobacillus]|uniref:sensor histidine kinase n=1 Tax=unclassified Mesobacillus TaxID=2675270 RepID=UPI0020414381|nr:MULTISPECIES: sensor histidine kinase [unclassified Mesobacillus]MCM3124307.1 sensor histidine kinase [Mesobacillus sp. MER 33]MCM3234983.1 sensor histidine kinase [Mesobacillus sp. MER 48]